MKQKIILFAVLLLVFFPAACKDTGKDTRKTGFTPRIGEHMKMVPFNLPSAADNTMIDSKQFAGKVLLVTFFATWCPPCIQEIPTLVELQNKYGAKGFSVIGMSVDEGGVAPVKRLIDRTGINYPVLMADNEVSRGFGGVTGIPVTYMVNRQGELVKKYLGYVEHDVLEEEIQKLLGSR
jgi:thiol-disulfide isomerase/thioredoxin